MLSQKAKEKPGGDEVLLGLQTGTGKAGWPTADSHLTLPQHPAILAQRGMACESRQGILGQNLIDTTEKHEHVHLCPATKLTCPWLSRLRDD